MFAYYLHCRLLSVTQCRQVTQTSLHDVGLRCVKYISEIHRLFIGDMLVFKSLNHALKENIPDKLEWSKCSQSLVSETELNTAELVELLQQYAVERLTTYRQHMAREFASIATIVTTDFEALYAYKRGDYQQCLQLSTHNVRTLLYAVRMPDLVTFPEFVQLLDDDVVSLTALMLIVNPKCKYVNWNICISQLTLSLYLMTQCQLKLRHSVTSLAHTLDYITVAQRRHPVEKTLDRLTLTLSKCKVTTYLRITLLR